ncbi:MAG: CusA/CzcA family heavy metal efflux RND transporter [Bryobacteraceae bacterium]|nr:CusA/CzcA family heavy metal efflux RND transporter [Bryobacteraceae bacterium]
MTGRIIDFSVRNRLLVLLIVAVATLGGLWSMLHVPLDAIPDLSETQVIIYSRWDRSPDVMEDQVTYPIVTSMLGAPRVKAVRGFSDFGYSFVYVIFEEGTDLYWARTRTLEYLSGTVARLPDGVKTELGPDATALGWVYQYVITDDSGKHTLADIRSYQDWYLRYYLKSVPGVAEVASVGGFQPQFQVNVDPNRLQAYGIPIRKVTEAVRAGNTEAGGRLIEFGGSEYMVRGRGYARSLQDIEEIVLAAGADGTPIRIRDIGQVALGPDLRRGLADLDGKGEVVSGIILMRQGQNALDVINRVKGKLNEIGPSLPSGMKILPIYDRSELIDKSIDNLKWTLVEVTVTVSLIILLFLWHIPSAIIPVVTIPIAVLVAFIPFRAAGMTANIMSLGGIAIAIGALVDAAIVVVEQTHKRLDEWERAGRPSDYQGVVVAAIKEVAGPSFWALLVIAVAFLPVLTLEDQEGRLFRPLAYTKTLSMVVAAVLTITLDPALRVLFTHVRTFHFRPDWLSRAMNATLAGRVHREDEHPVTRRLIQWYQPVVRWSLRWKWAVIGTALLLIAGTVPVYLRLGSEFMPQLDEGALLYMPSTMPGISATQARTLLQATDAALRRFPEVEHVLGKAGRADTPTDPAPLSMLETVITLKSTDLWRSKPVWYSTWSPEWLKPALRHITSDRLSREELIAEMNAALQVPGLSNAWTMPVKGRIDMLTTGIRTPVGLKVSGPDNAAIADVAQKLETLLKSVPGTRSVFAERPGEGNFLDIQWDRTSLARYGLSMEEAQAVVQSAIGGENVTTAIRGRERYPVNVRYMRDFRAGIDEISRVLVPVSDGQAHVPLSELAQIRTVTGPAMLRNEDGLLTAYVYVDIAGRDPGSYVDDARRFIAGKIQLPAGTSVAWSGQYEAMQRVRERLWTVVPVTFALILLLLYFNTQSIVKTSIIILAVPFSAVGAIWLLYLLGYNMSVGVWVGLIALLGVDAETGVFMLLYLDLSYNAAQKAGRLRSIEDLREAIVEGAAGRIRPKFMTVLAMFVGLIPILWANGTGADVMKRIAAPMVGGLFTSFLLELLVYPAIYEVWKWNFQTPASEQPNLPVSL